MKNILLNLILLFCIFAITTAAQDFHSKIKSAVEKNDYQSAISELQNLEKADNKTFEFSNYDYLLARMAEKKGDFALALANYADYENNNEGSLRNPVLREYALWHLSQIVGASGNLMLERIYLQKLMLTAPDSILSEAVKTRIVHNLFENGNFEEVIAKFHSTKDFLSEKNSKMIVVIPAQDKILGNLTGNDAKTRENLVLLGESYLQIGKKDEARQVFTKLVNTLTNPAQPDDFALAGAKNLDLLDVGSENFGKIAPQLTDNENYRRALIYQFNRNFPLARLHFQAIVERFPNSTFIANSLYQIGRSFAQEGNFSQAIEWFERVQAAFPSDDIARDALSQTASAYSRLNKPKEAISRYQKFIQTYPNADNLERPYLNIVDILRDQGENTEALKWTARTKADFKGKLPEAIALFAQAR
ncbi:MAG: tetratricopeptide repeat protein, partial [Acidobacteriota bacterium]